MDDNNNAKRVIIKLNDKIYDKHSILDTAFTMTDNAYFFIEKEPGYFIVSIKGGSDRDKIFQKRLLGRMANQIISRTNQDIRHTIIKRLLLTNEFRPA